jgi:hypothetical protein
MAVLDISVCVFCDIWGSSKYEHFLLLKLVFTYLDLVMRFCRTDEPCIEPISAYKCYELTVLSVPGYTYIN